MALFLQPTLSSIAASKQSLGTPVSHLPADQQMCKPVLRCSFCHVSVPTDHFMCAAKEADAMKHCRLVISATLRDHKHKWTFCQSFCNARLHICFLQSKTVCLFCKARLCVCISKQDCAPVSVLQSKTVSLFCKARLSESVLQSKTVSESVLQSKTVSLSLFCKARLCL